MALKFHARADAQDGPLYLRAQSVVEATSHRHVARATATARRVLEIGVGGGEHIVFGADPTRHQLYVGIDLDEDFARLCRNRHGIPVSVGDMSRLPFADGAFDCLVAMGVLEHVESLSSALAEAERVLERVAPSTSSSPPTAASPSRPSSGPSRIRRCGDTG